MLDDASLGRVAADVKSALRRKPAHEGRIGGALRVLAPLSPGVCAVARDAVKKLVKRGSFQRALYTGAVRALAQCHEATILDELDTALRADEAGGLATLSAVCFSRDKALAEPIARVATSRHPHLVFAAEVARVARRESNGQHIANVAPKIKESHRISLCSEVFVPLLWEKPLPVAIAPALDVLRDAERHLGRWLVLAEIAVRAGDKAPLTEARQNAKSGPASARAAWSMVAWALDEQGEGPPSSRPTVELVSRLSDRPSADRDMTFLFRLAHAGIPTARPMLENLIKGTQLSNETAVRAALYLAKDHERDDLAKALGDAASSSRREALRGLAAAALWDIGQRERAVSCAEGLVGSKQLPTATWAALLKAAHAGNLGDRPLVDEPTYRRVQLGWVE